MTMEDKTKTRTLTVVLAIFVRFFLVLHTLLATWRVAVAWDEPRYWLISLGVLLLILEGYITIRVNGGIEWKRMCPCFAIYLCITIPLVWLLEISQMNKYLESQMVPTSATTGTTEVGLITTTTQTLTSSGVESTPVFNSSLDVGNVTMTTGYLPDNTTTYMSTVPTITTTEGGIIANIENILESFSADTWIILVEESLVYLIVIGRWLLPRGSGTREELSDLLIDYLAMASDIMELFALFDEDTVRGNEMITYVILGIWSISFIQFIPVVMNRRAVNAFKRSSKGKNRKDVCCTCAGCGDSFPDIFSILSGLFLQDGPFLGLRLFVIIYLQILTYSLVFFVLKNIIVVLLLTYRLGILCYNLPCYHNTKATREDEQSIDQDHFVNQAFEDIIMRKNDADYVVVNTTDSVHQRNGSADIRNGRLPVNDRVPSGDRIKRSIPADISSPDALVAPVSNKHSVRDQRNDIGHIESGMLPINRRAVSDNRIKKGIPARTSLPDSLVAPVGSKRSIDDQDERKSSAPVHTPLRTVIRI